MIRTVCSSDSDNKYKYQSNNDIVRKFYMFNQDRNMPNAIYFEKYNNLLEVLRYQGIDIGCKPRTIKHELNNLEPPVNEITAASEDKLNKAKAQARAKYIAMAFLSTSDQNRYGQLLENLDNQHTQGYSGVFPNNIVEAYRILAHWRCEQKIH